MRYVFPLAHAANTFAMMVLMIIVSLCGRSDLAVEIGLVHAATLITFQAFSGDARSLVLRISERIPPESLLRLRLMLAIPLGVAAWALSAGASLAGPMIAAALIARRVAEWIAELHLADSEFHGQPRLAQRFLVFQTAALALACGGVLLGNSAWQGVALFAWSLSPLAGSVRFAGRALRRDGWSAPQLGLFTRMLPHFGSTLIIAVTVYAFRAIIVSLAGKTDGGDLITAYSLGGLLASVFAIAAGPSLTFQELANSRSSTFGGLVSRKMAGIATAYFAAGAVLCAAPEVGQWLTLWTGKSLLFWRASGASLCGGAVMFVAWRIRFRILQSETGDAFGPDVLSNLSILLLLPLMHQVLGAEGLAWSYLANACACLVFQAAALLSARFSPSPPGFGGGEDRGEGGRAFEGGSIQNGFRPEGAQLDSPGQAERRPGLDENGILRPEGPPLQDACDRQLASYGPAGLKATGGAVDPGRRSACPGLSSPAPLGRKPGATSTALHPLPLSPAAGEKGVLQWARNAVLAGLFVPIFFQLSNGIFQNPTFLFDAGGRLSETPFPFSIAFCYAGLLLVRGFQHARSGLFAVFLTSAIILLATVISSGAQQGMVSSKMLLGLQFLLPMPAFILGQAWGAEDGAIDRLAKTGFCVVAVMLPLQLAGVFNSGVWHIVPSTPLFAVYHAVQYVSVVLLSLYFLALFGLFERPKWRLGLLALAPAAAMYAGAALSLLAIAFFLMMTGVFLVHRLARGTCRPQAAAVAVLSTVTALTFISLSRHQNEMMENKYAFVEQGMQVPGNLIERLPCWRHYASGILNEPETWLAGHAAPPPRSEFPSAHNFALDFAYNLGVPALLPVAALAFVTLWNVARNGRTLLANPALLALTLIVLVAVFLDNQLKVGLRQPYSGIAGYFLWGVLAAQLAAIRNRQRPDDVDFEEPTRCESASAALVPRPWRSRTPARPATVSEGIARTAAETSDEEILVPASGHPLDPAVVAASLRAADFAGAATASFRSRS